MYGNAPNVYRSDLLKKFSLQAVNKAWAREKDLVTRGFSGNGNWSPVEVAELLGSPHGKVRGYETVELQPAEKYPQLARDGTNFEFVRTGQRNRKKRTRTKATATKKRFTASRILDSHRDEYPPQDGIA